MTGWGMDANPFRPLGATGVDVLMVSDYAQLSPISLDELQSYTACHLVAWSMGVWVAGYLLQNQHNIFTTRIAIGGTLDPVHNAKGIPPESYDAIAGAFSKEALEAFYRSMFTNQQEVALFEQNKPSRATDNLLAELTGFASHYATAGSAPDIFTHKVITSRDRVFPLKNQVRSWGRKNATTLKLSHFPFYTLGDWNAVLQITD